MKPKAPKKKDTKPNCKTGEVKEYFSINHIFNDKRYIKLITKKLENLHEADVSIWLESDKICFKADKAFGYLLTTDVINHYSNKYNGTRSRKTT